MIDLNVVDNATASGETDAPQSSVVVKSKRNPSNRYQKLSLGAWNVRTTNDSIDSIRPERATAIISRELKSANIDICAISEVRKEGTGSLIEKDYTFYWSGGAKKEAGVGFAVSNSLSNVTLDISHISDRLMTLRLQLEAGNYLKIVSVYGPTMQRPQEEKESFYSQLSNAIKPNKGDYIIVLGDFNARVGCDWTLWPDVLGRHGVGRMNSNGLMLLDFCTQNSLTIMGSMFQLRDSLKTTWQHPRSKHWHQLDHVLANNLARQRIDVTKANLLADCYTDHRLLVCKCSFSLRRKRKGKKPPVRPTIKVTQDKINQLQGYLEEHLTNSSHDWDDLKKCLQNAAVFAFGKNRKQNKDWFDENENEINALLKDRSKNKREIQKQVRQIKNNWFTNKAIQAENFYRQNNLREFYSTLREVFGPRSKSAHQICSKDGQLLSTDKDIKNRWVEHFSDLLNIETEADQDVLDDLEQMPVNESLDEPFNEEELDKAIKNMKSGKSPGPDGIVPEIIIHGGHALKHYLLTIFNIFWITEFIPSDLINPNIAILFKKGDRRQCGNYRGISLLSVVGKLIADMILQRLSTLTGNVYPESQQGYRAGRGTIDGIFTVRQLMEKSREQHCNLYIAFIDFTKAFDTVNRSMLFSILEKIGCPPKLIKLIKLLYTDVKARLIIDGELSKLFNYNSGVKQGCKLAPTLFGIYAAILLLLAFKDIKHDHSILIRFRTNGKFFDLRRLKSKSKVLYDFIREAQYADDIAIMSNSSFGLQALLDAYNSASKRFGLQINAGKTEVLCMGPETVFFVDKTPLENINRFKYLGSFVSKDCNLKVEITSRIQATSSAFGRLRQRVFDNHDLTVATKIAVYKQCLLPILLYGSETWTLYSHDICQLRTFQQRHLRSILRIKWNDFISNETVLTRANVDDIEVLLAKSRLRWLGHVGRMEDDRAAKKVLFGELADGYRTVGRPKLRFKDNCKQLLKLADLVDDWHVIAMDRSLWRSKIQLISERLNEIRLERYRKRKEKRQR